MKALQRIFLLCVTVLLIPAVASSCERCGSYVGIVPMDNQNSICILHSFRVYNGYRSMGQNGIMLPSGAYRYAQPPSVLHGATHGGDAMPATDFESYKRIELRGRYFVHERIQLEFVLPVINNKAKLLGNSANIWGIGDVSLNIGYRLIQSPAENEFRHRLIIGAGIKLPTGSYKSTYDGGDMVPLRMQPGTGSYDAIATLTYAAKWKAWMIGFTSCNRFCSSNSYYEQMTPVINNTLTIAKEVEKKSCEFYPQLQVYQEFTSGMLENGYLIAGTRMNNLLCGPGLEMYCKNFGAGACAQFPLYQDVYYMNTEMTWRLMVGVTYTFKSEKYLMH